MKRVSFALVLVALLLSFGLANATFRVEMDTYDENTGGCQPGTYLNTDNDIGVRVFYTQDWLDGTGGPGTLLGWSTPFLFTGPALNGLGTHAVDVDFEAHWDMGTFEAEESWDGDLSIPDQWNFSGISMDGYLPSSTEELVATFVFNFTAGDIDEVVGTFCIDSGDFEDDTYDWLFDPENPFGGPYCFPVKRMCNENAYITNNPTADISQDFDITFTHDFDATELEGDTPYTWAVDMGDIDANGVWTFAASCSDLGSHTVTVGVHDTEHAGDFNEETFTITVTNSGPAIAGDCGEEFVIGENSVEPGLAEFTATDPNAGDVLTWTVDAPLGIDAVITDGILDVESFDEGDFDLVITVTDCGQLIASCDIVIHVVGKLPFDIVINKVHGQLQGHHAYVNVTKERGSEDMLGFDLLIGYDGSALTFVGAIAGELFDMPGDYEWEYFTYRYNWNGNCGGPCPTGLLRVVGIADQNDGMHHPASVDVLNGTVLFTLDFLVTNDYNFECMFVPIHFYWMDCGDNTIAFHDATDPDLEVTTGVSEMVFMYGGMDEYHGEFYADITDGNTGFPTMTGFQLDCPDGGEGKPFPEPFVWFFGGGVDIICKDEIDDRGDVNMNGVANEIADAVVFTNYFMYGLAAFTVNVDGQMAATEINGDGIALTVADLVYLIRVIVGDALPLPKVAPNIGINVASGNVVNVDAEVGAASFTFAGNVNVTLADGAAGMELMTNYRDGYTHALVYSMSKDLTANGNILNTKGQIVGADIADYNGNSYKVSILPTSFALAQNYPNPFNPVTVINGALPFASDYSLTIYNVAGQKVADFSGHSEAGTVSVMWDATNQASGIYFYKFEAGSFSDTKKMVLLK